MDSFSKVSNSGCVGCVDKDDSTPSYSIKIRAFFAFYNSSCDICIFNSLKFAYVLIIVV